MARASLQLSQISDPSKNIIYMKSASESNLKLTRLNVVLWTFPGIISEYKNISLFYFFIFSHIHIWHESSSFAQHFSTLFHRSSIVHVCKGVSFGSKQNSEKKKLSSHSHSESRNVKIVICLPSRERSTRWRREKLNSQQSQQDFWAFLWAQSKVFFLEGLERRWKQVRVEFRSSFSFVIVNSCEFRIYFLVVSACGRRKKVLIVKFPRRTGVSISFLFR